MACPYCRAYPGHSGGKSKNLKIIEQRLGRAKQGLKDIDNFDVYQDFGFENQKSHKDYIIIKLKEIARQSLREIAEIKEK